MNSTPVSELALYRYRYFIGYTLLAVVAVILLILNFNVLPPGTTVGEEASAVASAHITFNFRLESLGPDTLNFLRTTDTIDLPYHLLQKISLQFFGLSPIGIRLPSTLLATASIFLFFGLIRRWLRGNMAIIAGVLVASSSWFVSVGRLGTPGIMVIFWTILILYLATLVSQESRYYHAWKALSLISIGLSLYTPYTIYLLLAAVIATMTQPHLRYIVNYAGKTSLTIGGGLLIAILLPLGFNIWNNPDVIWRLLAAPTFLPDPVSFLRSFVESLSSLLNPLHVSFTTVPRPLIPVSIAIIAGIGFVHLMHEWHSVRSHVLLIWLAILVPLVGLDTSHNLIVLFIPVMLLSSIGVQVLIAYWYTIFPRNPYARVFGLLPIGFLIISVIQFNYFRYFEGIPYAPTTASLYNEDPFMLTSTLDSKAYHDQRLVLIVPVNKVEFYKINQGIVANLAVIAPGDFISATNASRVIVAIDALSALTPAQQAALPVGKNELLVNDRKDNSLRFHVYSIF